MTSEIDVLTKCRHQNAWKPLVTLPKVQVTCAIHSITDCRSGEDTSACPVPLPFTQDCVV